MIQGYVARYACWRLENVRRLLNFAPPTLGGRHAPTACILALAACCGDALCDGRGSLPALVNVGVLLRPSLLQDVVPLGWDPIRRYGFRGSANRVVAASESSRTKFLPVSGLVLAAVVAAASTGLAVYTRSGMTTAQQSVEDGKRAAVERLKAQGGAGCERISKPSPFCCE